MKKLFIILLLFCSAFTHAQQLKVSADKNPALVGEQILVQYSINTKAENFKSPNFSGLQVLSGPNPSIQDSYSFVNGKSQRSSSTTYSFYLKAVNGGTYNISPAAITVNGKTITSKAYHLKVVKGTEHWDTQTSEGVNLDKIVKKESDGYCYLKSTMEKFNGLAYSNFTNGQLSYEGNYKDGKRNGLCIWWHENGQKKSERNYYFGIAKETPRNDWYENGQKKQERLEMDNDINIETTWHENGQKSREYKIKDLGSSR